MNQGENRPYYIVYFLCGFVSTWSSLWQALWQVIWALCLELGKTILSMTWESGPLLDGYRSSYMAKTRDFHLPCRQIFLKSLVEEFKHGFKKLLYCECKRKCSVWIVYGSSSLAHHWLGTRNNHFVKVGIQLDFILKI